jgi:hypothetical protein
MGEDTAKLLYKWMTGTGYDAYDCLDDLRPKEILDHLQELIDLKIISAADAQVLAKRKLSQLQTESKRRHYRKYN